MHPLTLLLSIASLARAIHAETHQIPATVQTGPTDVTYTLPEGYVDGVNIAPGPNATSWEWWYFDAISAEPGSNQTIVVNFVLTGPDAVPELGYGPLAPAGVQITGTFANGTAFGAELPAVAVGNVSATITTRAGCAEDGIEGVWHGTGVSFAGPLNGRGQDYRVVVDAPAVGIEGTLTIHSVSSPLLVSSPNCSLSLPTAPP
jgi:hypothetical protein